MKGPDDKHTWIKKRSIKEMWLDVNRNCSKSMGCGGNFILMVIQGISLRAQLVIMQMLYTHRPARKYEFVREYTDRRQRGAGEGKSAKGNGEKGNMAKSWPHFQQTYLAPFSYPGSRRG